MAALGKPHMPLEGEKTMKVEMGGYWRRIDFQAWWTQTHEANAGRGILAKPFELYVEFLLYLKDRIIAQRPELQTTDIYERKQIDHMVNSILNTAKPGWNQFCEMYGEMFVETPTNQTELDTKGDVAVRARARIRNDGEENTIETTTNRAFFPPTRGPLKGDGK